MGQQLKLHNSCIQKDKQRPVTETRCETSQRWSFNIWQQSVSGTWGYSLRSSPHPPIFAQSGAYQCPKDHQANKNKDCTVVNLFSVDITAAWWRAEQLAGEIKCMWKMSPPSYHQPSTHIHALSAFKQKSFTLNYADAGQTLCTHAHLHTHTDRHARARFKSCAWQTATDGLFGLRGLFEILNFYLLAGFLPDPRYPQKLADNY